MALCMTKSVDSDSDLGNILNKMPGLNQQTGEHGISGTCDPKHVIKSKSILLTVLILTLAVGFSTLLCSNAGILICDTNIHVPDIL